MEKELEKNEQQCGLCFGNHYIIIKNSDYVEQCPDCTIQEPNLEVNNNEKRT